MEACQVETARQDGGTDSRPTRLTTYTPLQIAARIDQVPPARVRRDATRPIGDTSLRRRLSFSGRLVQDLMGVDQNGVRSQSGPRGIVGLHLTGECLQVDVQDLVLDLRCACNICDE